MSESLRNSQTWFQLRDDGHLFDREYLLNANQDVAEDYLWPIPVLERHREDTQSNIGNQGATIQPGDVLEFCGEEYEEFLLVIGILPVPAAYAPQLEIKESDRILCYSSNTESYRLFLGENFIELGEDRFKHQTGEYFIHDAAADMVESSLSLPADVTHPPKPSFGDNNKLSNRVKQKYPHQYPGTKDEITPTEAEEPDNPIDIEAVENSIIQGDTKDKLKEFPSNSCHGWITSPAYYQVRDYNVENQLGQENTVEDYIESLLSIINQLMRVMRNDGVGCLVVDDVYKDGSLLGIPQMLHQEIDKKYDVIHHSPWTKPNGKPEAVDNRYTHTHEHILIIAHEGLEHYFDKEGTDDPGDVFDIAVGSTDTDHDAVFPEALPKELISTTIPQKVCSECGAPFEKVYEVTDIRNLDEDRTQAQRALELADKHDLTDEQLRAVRAVGLGDTGQSKRTQDGSGNNRSEIEELATQAEDALGSYAREFTSPQKEHTGYEPTCDCCAGDESTAKSGLVLDPFMGSGTTGLAAKNLRRRWVGIELNEDYIASAESRIGTNVSDPSRLRDNEQSGFDSYCQNKGEQAK